MGGFADPSVFVSRGVPAAGDGHVATVWVRGDHDPETRASLTVGIVRAAYRDNADVVLDLSGVTFMDASTVGAIVGSRNRLRACGHSLTVRAPSARALRVVALSGLADLIDGEPEHPIGVAAALGTWVHVSAVDRAGQSENETADVGAQPTAPRIAEPAAIAELADGDAFLDAWTDREAR